MPISIHLRGPEVDEPAAKDAVTAAFAVLTDADELFSTYREDSQVSRIRRGELALADADPLVAEVDRLCEQASEMTGGLFTPWLPDCAGVVRFDPSGLVKGWAVQRATASLAALARHTFLVNAGGDVMVGGDTEPVAVTEQAATNDAATDDAVTNDAASKHGSPWRIGIEDPRDRAQVAEAVELSHGAVATSGAAARGAHVYDPRTSQFLRRSGSATVIGPELMWADVWATALFVDPLARGSSFATAAAAGYRAIVQ